VDYRTLARWNGLHRPYTIYPGQLLRLKPPARHAGSTASRSGHKRPASKPKSSTAKPRRSHGKTATAHCLHWVWPLRGSLVSRFSYSDPDKDGIEIAGKRGQKVVAAESGTVVYSGSGLIGYGQLIIIKHNNEFLSAYGHNSKLLVKEGQKVKRGQHISNLGVDNRGRALLHFEIRRYGKPVDPLSYLPR
jgi:lipoprotein NlpD